MHTIKPVKRFDSVGSQREFVSSISSRPRLDGPYIPSFDVPSTAAGHITATGDAAENGRTLLKEVLNSIFQAEESHSKGENQAITKIRTGFEELVTENPALAWQTFVKLLEQVNR